MMDYAAFLKYRENLKSRLEGAIERIKCFPRLENSVWEYIADEADTTFFWLKESIEEMDVYRELFKEGKDVFDDSDHYDEITESYNLVENWLSRIELSEELERLIDEFIEISIRQDNHLRSNSNKKRRNAESENAKWEQLSSEREEHLNVLWKGIETLIKAKLSSQSAN
jgi:hypothetical protein